MYRVLEAVQGTVREWVVESGRRAEGPPRTLSDERVAKVRVVLSNRVPHGTKKFNCAKK